MSIQIRKILLPTDFSGPSRNAARYVASFAEEYNAKVFVLHVIDAPGPVSVADEVRAVDYREEVERGVAAEMRGAIPDTRKPLEVVHLTRHGRPYEEIIAVAKDMEVDLIVMGTHGRSGLSHILLGSTAERVVRSAPCPVLTVRHPEHEFVMP